MMMSEMIDEMAWHMQDDGVQGEEEESPTPSSAC